jgi:hypothetical protein
VGVKVVPQVPPRKFRVGTIGHVELSDCGRIELQPDEQVTFTTEAGGEYDVARKAWGFYATPSLNGRLPRFGLRPALVKGLEEKFFVMLVERGHEDAFRAYLGAEGLTMLRWLDDERFLRGLEAGARA